MNRGTIGPGRYQQLFLGGNPSLNIPAGDELVLRDINFYG